MNGQMNLFTEDTRPHRYLIMIHPGFHVTEKVKQFREQLNNYISLKAEDLYSRAHITVCYYDATSRADAEVVELVSRAVKNICPFTVEISGADFWDSGTFFLRVTSTEAIRALIQSIREQKGVSRRKENAQKIPHITIARNLSKREMSVIPIDEFAYKANFTCSSVTILKQVLEPEASFELLDRVKLKA